MVALYLELHGECKQTMLYSRDRAYVTSIEEYIVSEKLYHKE